MNAAAWVCLAVAGLVAPLNWWSRWRHDHRLELLTKPTVTSVLVAAALVLDANPGGARPWFVLGLLGCLVGDVMLMRPVEQFVAGLVAFLVGHVLFGIGATVIGVHARHLVAPALVVVALGGPVAWRVARDAGPLRPAVLTYFAAISAAGCLLVATGRWWAVVGAGAFMVSDSVLGWNQFVRPLHPAPVVVMVTYHAALLGLVLALR